MKKVISIALALLMVAVMLPVMAMAAEVSDEATLKDAVAAGGEVTLGADITASITIPAGTTVTLNLNGYKLTNEAGKDTITVKATGNLTITGNGTVDNVTHGKAALRIEENGKATLNGGYFNRSKENGQSGTKPGGNSFYTLINHGELIINDGAVVTTASGSNTLGRYSSLIENGYQSHNGSTNYPTLTINGGTFKGGINTIKNDDNGIATIKGGSSTNYYQASVQNHHKMVIENGSFSGETAWSVLNCGSCSSFDPTHDAHELVIKNGNFKGDVRANVGNVEIKGGSFEASFTEEGNANIEISGGTFNTNVTPYVGENTLVVVGGSNYYVGDSAYEAVGNATSGEFTVVGAPSDESLSFQDVKPGVTVKNGTGETVTVNGNNVPRNESYTVPGAPIIIYTPTEDTSKADNQKNPSTGANDFVSVAAAMAVVSLLGAAAVIRKK